MRLQGTGFNWFFLGKLLVNHLSVTCAQILIGLAFTIKDKSRRFIYSTEKSPQIILTIFYLHIHSAIIILPTM